MAYAITLLQRVPLLERCAHLLAVLGEVPGVVLRVEGQDLGVDGFGGSGKGDVFAADSERAGPDDGAGRGDGFGGEVAGLVD